MKKVWFIRHGESEANAGLPTSDPSSIVLTSRGIEQANSVAELIEVKPDLVIMSSYIRTQQTATPYLNKHSNIKTETWPIHEFDFLSPNKCINTTVEQRKPWVKNFWDKCETEYIHGEDAESFGDFKSRILASVKCLEEIGEKNIIVFTHGHVIRGIWQYFITNNTIVDKACMEYFRNNMSRLPVPNTSIFKANFKNGAWQNLEPDFNPFSTVNSQ